MLVCGVNSENEAYTLYKASKEILSHASFNLRKFVTNVHSLQDRVEVDEKLTKGDLTSQLKPAQVEPLDETYVETTLPSNVVSGPGQQKVLGVRWCVKTDQFVFEFTEIANAALMLSPTKRNVISIIGHFYDPLGFLSPITIRCKVFMQELCRSKLTWDQFLEGRELRKWLSLIDDLDKSQPVMIPRRFLPTPKDESKRYRLYGYGYKDFEVKPHADDE